MRTVTSYYAYDDTYFYTRKECEEYERQAMYHINQFNRCCALFDANKRPIYLPAGMDIEEAIDWLNEMLEECEYIEINEPLSTKTISLLKQNISYALPENKTGLYKYDYNGNKWVSAS